MFKWIAKRRTEKCESKGHPLTKKTRGRYLVKETDIWYVASEYILEIRPCRCGKEEEVKKVEYLNSFTSISLGSDMMRAFHKYGRVRA
jgi:hypothetical protein